MKVDFVISADYINGRKLGDKSVVVIDMLRATSVIVTAFINGCKDVIPVTSIEEARDISESMNNNAILGGERKALKIEGFNCSNSPLEYTYELVREKTLIITTSNGTRAIKGSQCAKDILIGAMINAKAVARKLMELKSDVVIVNAGTAGEFSMDDFICGGYITDCLCELVGDKNMELSDIAYTALYVYRNNKDIKSFIKEAKHYKRMIELGYMEDLDYCTKKDITEIVPICIENRIIRESM
ncbi:MAG: 2-phosphosulfolactate phosphatase family protein [Clostridium sp.]